MPVSLELVDISAASDPEAEARALVRREASRPFDLRHGPLWRTYVVRLSAKCHWFVVVAHHIVLDDWTVGLLLQEMNVLLSSLGRGEPLPPRAAARRKPLWRQEAPGDVSRHYWLRKLADVPVLSLPRDQPRRAGRRRTPAGTPASRP